MKVAFLAWNPFQIQQILGVAEQIASSTIILQHTKYGDQVISENFLKRLRIPYQVVETDKLPQLDGTYDAIVCQTASFPVHYFCKTKIIMMQYSLAKERHQYGYWRIFADLNLVFGKFSYEKVKGYGPTVIVGNPKMDRWFSGEISGDSPQFQGNDSSKKTLLYLPTWSDLSSLEDFMQAAKKLACNYNLHIKLHHNSFVVEQLELADLKALQNTKFFGPEDDLLALLKHADLVISDYSGAIFDSIQVGIPVVLLQTDPEDKEDHKKFTFESIEFKRRSDIGQVVNDPNLLAEAVDSIFSGKVSFKTQNTALKGECFAFDLNCSVRAADAIKFFLENPDKFPREDYQIYLRDQFRELAMKKVKTIRKMNLRRRLIQKAKRMLNLVR